MVSHGRPTLQKPVWPIPGRAFRLDSPVQPGEMVGTIAFLKDAEGNRIGLHVPPNM